MNDMTAAKPGALPILAPQQQEGSHAILRTWLKAAGARVNKDEPVAELETDKVMVELCAPAEGELVHVLKEGDEVVAGASVGQVETGQQEAHPAPQYAPELRLSPAVRRLLSEHHLDPAQLEGRGTGRGGRLTREDVQVAIQEGGITADAETPPPPVSILADPLSDSTRIPHTPMRKRIAEHMQQSVNAAPHVTSVFEIDCTAILAHRSRHQPGFLQRGVKLSLTAYFIAATVAALKQVPQVNSRWHPDALEVFSDMNIGIGTALGDAGLVVPVIHQAQRLSLEGIAEHLQQLTEAARTNRLVPEQVRGGTFTLSNHGVSGSLFATPIIINQPQSAILGIGALEKRVVVTEVDGIDTFQARARLYASLTIDHRALDAHQANAWLSCFKETLEHWR